MKKSISYILLSMILALCAGGCGTEEKEPVSTSNTEEPQGAGGSDRQEGSADPGGVSGSLAVSASGIRDNSLDAYSAIVNTALGMGKPMNAMEGGGQRIFLGISRAWYFKKHIFENVEECWDELSFVTMEGETGSKSFGRENQLWGAGPAAGTDHYVTLDYEAREREEDYRYFLTERDENHEPLREFPLDILSGSSFAEVIMSLSDFAVDHSGVVHLVRQMEEGQQYLLISPEGDALARYVPESGYIKELVPLYDGRVVFWAQKQDGEALQYLDAGSPVTLAALDKDVYCYTLCDENTLLYADREGVYRCGLSGDNPELLYRWSNHGIMAQGVSAMQVDEEGRIALLYRESENSNYLCLEPATEEVEICELTLAVPFYQVSVYQPFVVEFNKRYPAYHMEIKSDYDNTALLTELAAGKGPVLIDTQLTGFEEQEKLWEPLDTLIEQTDMAEELQPIALEMGKIDGTLYGIVTDFSLRTMVTKDPELKDWDYETFLRCVEDRPELEAIFNFDGGDYGTYFIMNILSHGMNDTYLLDAEAGTMNFDSDGFRRALELAKKYCVREEGAAPGSSLLEGKALCNELYIKKPEQLALYRACYGEDANYIGYPAKDGSRHFIVSNGSPLAIRRTAAEEEKEMAAAFLALCLSYEGQSRAAKDVNFGLSVRRDVLEEQIASMNERTEVHVSGFGQFRLGGDLNIELDRETLLSMIEKAEPLEYFPRELREVMFEELALYFSGDITEELLIDHLESRVGLYLGERN